MPELEILQGMIQINHEPGVVKSHFQTDPYELKF
jgi:hypothetical protein